MRYKNNALQCLEQAGNYVNRVEFEVNRGYGQEKLLESIEMLKTQLEGIREILSMEPDDFEQQFSNR